MNLSTVIRIIGISAVVILLFAGYVFFFTGPQQEEPLASESSTAGEVAASELLSLLERLEGIKLNADFFSASAFQGLKDFGVDIAPQPQGRPNPFTPLR